MNVNLLESKPDWRWYILFGALSCLLTGAMWIASKYLPNLPVSAISQTAGGFQSLAARPTNRLMLKDRNGVWRKLSLREKAPLPNSSA